MNKFKLVDYNFMALCCVIGIISKKLINPFANVITDLLHIPGGVSTGFSIMFLVIAVEMIRKPKCGTLMAMVQGLLSLALGRVGSMGIFMPISFIATGIAIDFVYYVGKYINLTRLERMMFSNSLAAFSASFVANFIVFQLTGPVLCLYLSVSALSGMCYGFLSSMLVERINPALSSYRRRSYEIT